MGGTAGTNVDILSNLCVIEDSGAVIPFSQISTLNTNVARLIYGSVSGTTCTVSKYTHAAGSAITNTITIDTKSNIFPGTYSMKLFYTDDLTTVKNVA